MNRKVIRKLIVEALSSEEISSLQDVSHDKEALKSTWRKLLKKHHPDRAKDNEKEEATATTQELNALYDQLSKKSSSSAKETDASSSSSQKSQDTKSQKNKEKPKQMSDDEISDKIDLASSLSVFYRFYKMLAGRYFENDKDYYGYLGNLERLIDNSENLDFVEKEIDSLHLLGYDNDLNFRTSFLSLCYLNRASVCLARGKPGFSDFKTFYKKAAENSYMNYTKEGQEIIASSLEAIDNIENLVSVWQTIRRFFASSDEELAKQIQKVSSLTSHNAFAWKLHQIYLKKK